MIFAELGNQRQNIAYGLKKILCMLAKAVFLLFGLLV